MPLFYKSPPPDWFAPFVDELEVFASSLPENVSHKFKRSRTSAELKIEPPTRDHHKLFLEVTWGEMEYSLGKIWTEQIDPSQSAVRLEILALCDAVRDGRVREVRDRRTGLLYHIYRLKTRGLSKFARDSEYALGHYLKWPVRKVGIHRLPPLSNQLVH